MIRKWIVFALVLGAYGSFAEKAPSPQETIKKSRVSRADFIEAIGDVEKFVPTMNAKEVLFPYLFILDELKELGKKYKIEELGGDPVASLASEITRAGVKWIRIDQDDPKTLEVFLRWSEDNSRFLVSAQHIKHLNIVQEKKHLLHWNQRTALCLDYVTKLGSEPYVLNGFGELQGAIIRKLLALKKEITDAEVLSLIQGLRSQPSMLEVVTFLSEESLNENEPTHLHRLLHWSIALGITIAKLPSAPLHLKAAPGQVILESLSKLLQKGEAPDEGLTDSLLKHLTSQQKVDLGSLVMVHYQERPIPQEHLDFLFFLGKRLLQVYMDQGMGEKLKDFEKFFQKVAALIAAKRFNIEGTYALRAGNYPATLTIANAGNGHFILGLNLRWLTGQKKAGTDFSFMHVAYDPKKDVWQGHHFALDSPIYPQFNFITYYIQLKFIATKAGTSVTGHWVLPTNQTFAIRGFQTESYPNYASDETEIAQDAIEGQYAYGGGLPVLGISNVGHRTTGRFSMENRFASIDLIYGSYNPFRSYLYLTSGEMESHKWGQVRGHFMDGGKRFEGVYIIGGWGIAKKLNLTRTSDE